MLHKTTDFTSSVPLHQSCFCLQPLCLLCCFFRWWFLRDKNLHVSCSFSEEAWLSTRASERRPLMRVHYYFFVLHLFSFSSCCCCVILKEYSVCFGRLAYVLCAWRAPRGRLPVRGGLLLCRSEVQRLCRPAQ